MKGKSTITNYTVHDPAVSGLSRNACYLRSYQAEALRTIFGAVMTGRGGKYAVMFPRQSGKNETQAQLEAAVMAAAQHKGGNIIKVIPTEKNQGRISTERLESILRTKERGLKNRQQLRVRKDTVQYGNTGVRCLSANPNAAIVGATADLMLEVDEAQMVPAEKYDREAAPMAASSNAVQVFWGTAWDDRTLLAREMRQALRGDEENAHRHLFVTTAAEVGKEVPEYGAFVREQIERLGREHPAIRTQFFCEEITDLTSMFTPARMERMQGSHEALYLPDPERCYVFLIDVAGSDEVQPREKRVNGFSDRRDATVVTVCEVSLPEEKAYDPKNFVWKTVARRLYRNLPCERLEKEICGDIDQWRPRRIIIDHSGLGAMLSDILTVRYRNRVLPVDITASNKTKMAWDFLAMVDTGRWIEHRADMIRALSSPFTPGKEKFEVLKEPGLLQQMFYRELRACRIEPTGNPNTVRWGVKEGTRDHVTGRVLHDDLVMSAAMAVFEDGTLPVCSGLSGEDWVRHYEEVRKMASDHYRTLKRGR